MTRTEVVVASHCFEHCSTVITINVHIKTVDFFLFSGYEKALNFILWSCFLLVRLDQLLKLRV